jgi:hypothetical protein
MGQQERGLGLIELARDGTHLRLAHGIGIGYQ